MPVERTMTILFLFHIAILTGSMSIHFRKLKVLVRQRVWGLTCGARSTTKLRKATGSQRSGKKKCKAPCYQRQKRNGRIRFTHECKNNPELGIAAHQARAREEMQNTTPTWQLIGLSVLKPTNARITAMRVAKRVKE